MENKTTKIKFNLEIIPTWADCSEGDLQKVFDKLPIPRGDFLQGKAFFEIDKPKFHKNNLVANGTIVTELVGSRVDRLVMGVTQKAMRFVQKRGYKFKIDFDYK